MIKEGYDEHLINLAKELINSRRCSIVLVEKLNELIFRIMSCKELELFSEEEQWKQIKDYPNYEISTKGRVRSISRDIILKSFISNSGYEFITLCNEGKCKKYSIHRLVCSNFREKEHEELNSVDHIDGNKHNNNVNNLRWVNNSMNQFNRYNNAKIK